jgi:photosystem II stability/assembly factor-like uncharacterized protein
VDVKTIWQCGMQNLSVSMDGGETWNKIEGKQGGWGCLVSFVDTRTGILGFGDKFEMTTDGGATWNKVALPDGVSKVAAISLRTAKDGYLLDDKGILYVTADGCKTWTSRSLGLENPGIMGFVTGGFVNEIPQAAVRFTDAGNGLVVLGLSGKDSMTAMRTADGGKTWKVENLPTTFLGAPYISRDGKFVTVNSWNVGTMLLKYE